ncbi:hypothetical protein [Candidatus Solirubrobacter pratensis]|nr:hypothetical protein [Candidatus Solirubrobacter pratensis]
MTRLEALKNLRYQMQMHPDPVVVWWGTFMVGKLVALAERLT